MNLYLTKEGKKIDEYFERILTQRGVDVLITNYHPQLRNEAEAYRDTKTGLYDLLQVAKILAPLEKGKMETRDPLMTINFTICEIKRQEEVQIIYTPIFNGVASDYT